MVAGHRDLLRGRADPAGKSPAGGGTRQPDCSSADHKAYSLRVQIQMKVGNLNLYLISSESKEQSLAS